MTHSSQVVVGFRDATPLLSDPIALRAQADADGYLFFKQLLPKSDVQALRDVMLGIIDQRGWLDKDVPRNHARVNHDAVRLLESWGGTGVDEEAYRELQKNVTFQHFQHHPRLIALYSTLFGEAVLPHPRTIARMMVPCPSFRPTPMHQDYIHIQGTRDTWTCWLPVGDVPRSLGGLTVLHGSHRLGVLTVRAAEGAGNLETNLCDVDLPWIEHDYEMGDILTFNSCLLHKSLAHQQPDTVRFSCDFRYQPAADDIEAKSLIPHMQVATWEEIYRDWPVDARTYYWREQQTPLSPWDESLHWQKERICN
jgi:ectoine hydroxylase-related dioxygenase (phytanoyl-CoA dioxygenase family)